MSSEKSYTVGKIGARIFIFFFEIKQKTDSCEKKERYILASRLPRENLFNANLSIPINITSLILPLYCNYSIRMYRFSIITSNSPHFDADITACWHLRCWSHQMSRVIKMSPSLWWITSALTSIWFDVMFLSSWRRVYASHSLLMTRQVVRDYECRYPHSRCVQPCPIKTWLYYWRTPWGRCYREKLR